MTKSKLSGLLWCGLLWCGTALANNSPEDAQRRAQDDIIPKVDLACGTKLTIQYDGESLKKNNKDVGYDQTGGDRECNEPLRLIWYACKTGAGKAAVKSARLHKVICRGTPGAPGSLRIDGGVITVERSVQETEASAPDEDSRMQPQKPADIEKQYTRSHRQFEAAMKLSLALASEDPYQDETWNDLAQQPNPVTSTSDYCMVNGKKMAFEENERSPDSFVLRKEDATVKCWKAGQVITDLVIKKGLRTGLLTDMNLNGTRRSLYRDGKLHGEQTLVENGKPKWQGQYENGEEMWHREMFPSGKLDRYWRKAQNGRAEIHLAEDGRVYGIRCTPDVKDDKELRNWCGFGSASTVQIYDGTGKVSRVQTWKDGVLQKEGAGDSRYASGVNVAYKDGKKHGEERIVGLNGKLHLTVEWNHGVQDGKELEYDEEGKKVVKETVYKSGEIKEVTEYFLNGNPKSRETFEAKDRKYKKRFWDTGKVREEGTYVMCRTQWGSNDWCEDGTHKTFYENGSHESERPYEKGVRRGTTTSWWPDGKPQSVESYANDKRTKAKQWDKDGKVVLDEEYEADGSRKRH